LTLDLERIAMPALPTGQEPNDQLISVVIPVYNEAGNLKPLYEELAQTFQESDLPFELIYVDDGSTDTSYPELCALHQMDQRVRVIQFRRNFGQTAAFAAGFDHARGHLIVTIDADGQNNPADIPVLIEKLRQGKYDLVTGWRLNRKEPMVRRLVSSTANWIISRSTKITIRDRGCSLKVFDCELTKQLRIYGQLHRFLPEMASTIGAKVGEVPVQDRKRRSGQSKYGSISRTPRVILDLFTVFFLLSFFTSPMRFFGSMGLVSLTIGFISGAWLALTKIYQGLVGGWVAFHAYEIGNRPLLLFSVLLITVGIQFLMMGLLGEMIMRVYYEASGRPIYAIRTILD